MLFWISSIQPVFPQGPPKQGKLERAFSLKHLVVSKIVRIFAGVKQYHLSMEPKIGDRMKVSPHLTAQADWVDGEVIDVEHNPFVGLVISVKDKLGRIFFGQSRFFIAL